jgi:DNA-binding transcriptional LysR family regulator
MQLDLIDLRLFLQVAEAGSVTHGARRAHLALAAASTRIRNLESLFGVPLLLRNPRGVNLTPAGHTLAHYARAVFQQIENLRGEFEEHTGGFKGQVRVFSGSIAHNEFLPQALSSFLIEHPGVNIDVEERPSNEIIRGVVEGVAHIGIVSEPVSIAGLQTFSFKTYRLVLVAPKNHPVARRRRISFPEALGHDFIGLPEASAFQQFLSYQASRLGLRLRIRVRLPTFEGICQMVENRVGLAVVPESAAARYQASMEVRTVNLEDSWAVRDLRICIRSMESLPPAAKRLAEHLKAA